MLNIGFDAKRLFNNFTGLGNYSRTLVESLRETFPNNKYHLFTPRLKDNTDTNFFFNNDFNIITPEKGNKSVWRSKTCTKDIKRLNLDIYHGLSHELPVGIAKTTAKSLVTIHDLIYKTYPNDFKKIDRKIYDYKFKYACEKADKIIAVSQSTKSDLQSIYNVPNDRIEVIYQSCLSQFKVNYSNTQKDTIIAKYNLPAKFLLYVGSIIERKNLLGLVKAIEQIKDQLDVPLIVIGNGKQYKTKVQKYIHEHKLEKHVRFIQNVTFTDLPLIYQLADIFIYPSFYEGFGIPLIESLWSKTPVITSNLSSLPEAAGPGALYCKPDDHKSIAEGILKLSNNKELKEELTVNGYKHVQQFDNKLIAESLFNIYSKVLEE